MIGQDDRDYRDNENTLTYAKQAVEEQHKEQDEILDDMSKCLQRINVINGVMSTELEHHNQLLDEVEEEMDIAQDKLTAMTERLDKILGHSDKNKICLIVILVQQLI